MWTVVYSDEVTAWLDTLKPNEYATARRAIHRLAAEGHNLSGTARRITYTFQPEQQIITLTTFRKQKSNERREILRARRAQQELQTP